MGGACTSSSKRSDSISKDQASNFSQVQSKLAPISHKKTHSLFDAARPKSPSDFFKASEGSRVNTTESLNQSIALPSKAHTKKVRFEDKSSFYSNLSTTNNNNMADAINKSSIIVAPVQQKKASILLNKSADSIVFEKSANSSAQNANMIYFPNIAEINDISRTSSKYGNILPGIEEQDSPDPTPKNAEDLRKHEIPTIKVTRTDTEKKILDSPLKSKRRVVLTNMEFFKTTICKNVLKIVKPIIANTANTSINISTHEERKSFSIPALSPISMLSVNWENSTIDKTNDVEVKGSESPSKKQRKSFPSIRPIADDQKLRRKSEDLALPKLLLGCSEDSSFVESFSVIAKRDETGNKYINQYMIIETLGKGSFGVVKLCYDTVLHKKVAMKIINKNKLKKLLISKTTTAYKLVQTEIAIMKKICHPNIVKLFEIIDDPQYAKLFIIMESISGGSLLFHIKHNSSLPPDKCWKYYREIISGLEYCHEVAGIIHRDIKPENILIDDNDHVHIVDFGVSYIIENGSDESKATLGSRYYMSPEILFGEKYKGRKTDVWASGVTLYYMSTGKLPFIGLNKDELAKSVREKEPEYPQKMDPTLVDLLKKVLQKDPEKRATINEIKCHPWITKNNKYIMDEIQGKIFVSQDDKNFALASFSDASALARLKMLIKRRLKRFREKIAKKKLMKKQEASVYF